jgi:hypothetical protein
MACATGMMAARPAAPTRAAKTRIARVTASPVASPRDVASSIMSAGICPNSATVTPILAAMKAFQEQRSCNGTCCIIW